MGVWLRGAHLPRVCAAHEGAGPNGARAPRACVARGDARLHAYAGRDYQNGYPAAWNLPHS